MCGRFVSASPPDQIAKYFGAEAPSEALLEPSYNVAPTNDVYVVLESGGIRKVEVQRWGLVPFWAKDLSVANRMINARTEGLATNNAYKHAFAKRRCIIPADGFYEWKKRPGQKHKQPMYIHRTDGGLLAFAGLWEVWRNPEGPDEPGSWLHSCTVITGEPNDKVAEVHDRMPVILADRAWDSWLDEGNHDTELLGKLLVPAPSSVITIDEVSTEVNNVRNKGSHLIDPVRAAVDADAAGGGTRQGRLL